MSDFVKTGCMVVGMTIVLWVVIVALGIASVKAFHYFLGV